MSRTRHLLVLSLAASLPVACGDGPGSDASDGGSSGGATSGSTTDTADSNTTPTSADSGESESGTASNCPVTPVGWDAPNWDANTTDARAVRIALDTLAGDTVMRGAETGTVILEGLADLTAVWEGDPRLADIAHPGFSVIVEDAFAEFIELIEAGRQELLDGEGNWAPGPAGGIWGDDSRGINEGGLEVRQMIDKGGYGGLMYAYAVELSAGPIDASTVDAIAAAWGTNAALDPEGELTDAANYGYQMGFHGAMAAALTDAKAYAGDARCEAERDQAVVEFFRLWELSLYARLVFYGNRAESKLLAATSGSEFADTLHDLSEGLAVAIGFHGLPDPADGPLAGGARVISDAQVDAAAAALGMDVTDLGASTTGELLQSLPNLEEGVAAVEAIVIDVYGVDAATIQTYVSPSPG